jgi:hypothetical protein
MIRLTQTKMKIHPASSIRPIKNKLFTDETSMIRITQTRMKIHYASSIRPIKNKLFTDEIDRYCSKKCVKFKKTIFVIVNQKLKRYELYTRTN